MAVTPSRPKYKQTLVEIRSLTDQLNFRFARDVFSRLGRTQESIWLQPV
jgi:hypothetical protein